MSKKKFELNSYRFLVYGLAIAFFVLQTSNSALANPAMLSGTYQIDQAKSADVYSLVENTSRRDQLLSPHKRDLQVKLNPPEAVAIQINGQQVVLSSSVSNPTTLFADGLWKTSGENGSTVKIRTDIIGDALRISSLYDDTSFSITFRPTENGSSLRVTRTVKTDYLKQTVVADSFYNRIDSPVAFSGNFNVDNRFSSSPYIVPSGTVLAGVLENRISTRESQNNDQFRLTVQSPNEFRGAVIEGYLSGVKRSNGISGKAQVELNFQKITMPNGKTYDFAGALQSIEEGSDTNVKSTDESLMKGRNQTNEAIKRGVIAGGVGAIIGAAINGTKGALIGAAIGGAGGPATLMLEKDHNIVLAKGVQINVQSTTPVE